MSFWDLLRPTKPPTKAAARVAPITTADLRAALAEAQAAAAAAEQQAAEIAGERQSKLLLADDATLDEVERRLQAATREADRTGAAVEALQTRLRESEAADAAAARDAAYAVGDAALQRGLALYVDFGDAAVRLRDLALQLRAAHDEIETANATLAEAGDARRIVNLDATARPQTTAVRQVVTPPWWILKLPSSVDPIGLLYPTGIDASGLPISKNAWPDR